MSIRLMSKVFAGLDVDVHTFAVLVAMADWANDDGVGLYPSIARISRRCRVSERQVQRIVSKLEGDGVLERLAPGGGKNTASWRMVEERIDALRLPPPDPGHEGPKWARRAPSRGDSQSPLDPVKGRLPVVGGVTGSRGGGDSQSPISVSYPSEDPKSAGSAEAAPPEPPAERFELGGFIDDYGEITGGILPAATSARPLRDVARLYGLEVARAGWRDYVASRHREARPAKAAWFAEEAGRWCKRATGRPAPNPAAPRHPLWGWVREHTPQRRNDPDSGYRAWLCAECEAKRLVPTERDGWGRPIPPPPGKVWVARHEAFDPALVGKCPAELGYELDAMARVVGIAEVRRAK